MIGVQERIFDHSGTCFRDMSLCNRVIFEGELTLALVEKINFVKEFVNVTIKSEMKGMFFSHSNFFNDISL